MQYYNDLLSLNNDVKKLLDQWNSKLNEVLKTSEQFEIDHKQLNTWLSDVNTALGNASPVHAIVEGVVRQIEEMEV